MTKHRPLFRRRARAFRAALLLGGLAVLGWIGGFIWFAQNIPMTTPDSPAPTDAIVVLTGGSGRLHEGLDLLASGKGKKLFVSGVYRGVDVAALLRVSQQEPGNLECCINLGYQAGNTHGNADETARWMTEQGYKSLRLVTANYHMRRSLLEFRRTMPWADIYPHPIRPNTVAIQEWWRSAGATRLLLSEYAKYLIAVTVGSVIPDWADA